MKPQNRVSIVLADDYPIIRQGLAALLRSKPTFQIVGEAEDGLAAVEIAERVCPDIMIVDSQMPGLVSSEVVRQMRLRVPQTRAIIFSMHATDANIVESFRLGAWSYLLGAWSYLPKEAATSELIQAIHTVRSGKRYLCKSVPGGLHQKVVRLFEGTEAATHEPIAPYDTLTTREREVFQLLAEGLSNME